MNDELMRQYPRRYGECLYAWEDRLEQAATALVAYDPAALLGRWVRITGDDYHGSVGIVIRATADPGTVRTCIYNRFDWETRREVDHVYADSPLSELTVTIGEAGNHVPVNSCDVEITDAPLVDMYAVTTRRNVTRYLWERDHEKAMTKARLVILAAADLVEARETRDTAPGADAWKDADEEVRAIMERIERLAEDAVKWMRVAARRQRDMDAAARKYEEVVR